MSYPLDSHSIDPSLNPNTATRGSLREVLNLAWPVVATQLSITMMGVVDSMMVGQLGATELAAVGFGGIWVWTLICFWIGSATVIQTFVSQAHGAGLPLECGKWAWQGLGALVPMALVSALLLYVGVGPLVAILDPGPTLAPVAVDYMQMRSLGVAAGVATMVLASFFRGLGDTRTPLYITIFANVVNVVLDYGLIFGELGLPQWGVAGAGIATAVSEWLGALILFSVFLRPAMRRLWATGPVAVESRRVRRLLWTGLPVGGQWVLEMLSFAIFMVMVARMSDAAMAASQAFISLLSLSFMQASGIGIAVSTLVGRYIGAGDEEAVWKSYTSGMWMAAILGIAIALLFVTVPGPLVGLFSTDAEVLRLGGPLLMIGAVFQIFDAGAIVTDGALRGAGDTQKPFLIRFLLAWLLFLPLAWWAGMYLGGGLFWAWAAGVVFVLLLAVFLIWRFRSGAWRHIQI